MKSAAADVTSYLQEVPADRKEALKKLRNLCLDILIGYEEAMEYGGPVYKRNGVIEVGFASQKNHIGLYILKEDVVLANKELLKGLSVGKGCIRYSKPEKIDFAVVERLLVGTRESDGPIC